MALAELTRVLPGVRIHRRTLIAGAAAAGAALVVLIITRPVPTTPVLVAGADIPAGTPLAEAAITTRSVTSPGGLVAGESLGELADWTLVVPIEEGEPLLPSLLRPPAMQEASDVLALSLEATHAALGTIQPGDWIDVYATFPASPDGSARTELIASEVYVVEARMSSGSVGEPSVELLLAVDGDLAMRLANASTAAQLDLVRRGR